MDVPLLSPGTSMKIHLASFEDGITATGFRKVAGFIERLNPETRVFYVGTNSYRSLWKSFSRRMGNARPFGEEDVDRIAQGLAGADIIGLSSMTGYSDLTRRVAARLKVAAPKSFVMWGGIHPIIYPTDAIAADVDAICTGEGEFAFERFFDAFKNGRDFSGIGKHWVKRDGEVTRNPFIP